MRYRSPHTEQDYSIQINDTEWIVKFAPHWKTYKKFTVQSDEHIKQVFHLLNSSKACEECQRALIRDRSICEECRILKLANQAPATLTECPVCYEPILDILDNRMHLICGHQLCTKCTRRMSVQSDGYTWNPINGLTQIFLLKCPMCRRDSTLTKEYKLVVYPDLFSYLGVG